MTKRRWTPGEIEFLKQHYGKYPLTNLASLLGRTENAIRSRAGIERLTKQKSPQWTNEEIEFLKERFTEANDSQLARALRRTTSAIRNKIHELGLPREYLENIEALDLSIAEAAYAAGFIDGEGCVRFSIVWQDDQPIRAVPVVEVSNSNKEVLDWLADRVSPSGRWQTCPVYKKAENRYIEPHAHYHLAISGRPRVKAFLLAIIPHLRIKKARAQVVLRFCDQHQTGVWNREDWDSVLTVKVLTNSRKHPHIESRRRLAAWIEQTYGSSR